MLVKHLVSRLRLMGVVLAAAALAACGGGGGGGGGGSGGGGTDTSTPTTSITLPYSAALSGTSGAKRNFTFTLPAGLNTLSVKLSGGTGNVTMSATDSTGATKCPSVTKTGYEISCNVNNPASGLWTIAIIGASSFNNVDLSVASNSAGVSLPYNASGLSGAVDSDTLYTFTVPVGTVSVQAQLSNGTGATGNADLYLIAPSGSTGDMCISNTAASNVESCSFNSPGGTGTWMVQVRGTAAYSGATLSIATAGTEATGYPSFTSTAGSEAVDSTYGPVTGALDSSSDATVTLGAGVASMTATISGGTGNADIVIFNPAGKPVCRTRASGNTDACSILKPEAGAWKVRLFGTTAFTGVTLQVTKI